ncbi:endo-1,3-beta-glucanase [Verticillium alfalfae VaMs.102]|uniref:Endo-1,3-beta-glucanase n=1 Tax=Verticillium alfalfae (strain VaMs.102 / ATCC MYA-4576 / FGSC 10136) TaxID=526221 RepID=C9S6T1_VERA1|nr:endo-1,3-beta-glucanase [Verticillium alfalfae VaMs.102]EEY15184.1 endo-1,3-beta-glucanase [Verticillium alfalfae VaMs.102]
MVASQVIVGALCLLAGVEAAVPKIPGFWLTWADDFNGRRNSLPRDKNWIFDVGTSYPGGPPNWGTGEIQTYTKNVENVHLNGKGNLQITAIRDKDGAWTSSRIETQRADFMAKKDRIMIIQADLKIPDLGSNGVGYWPAFWTLGADFRGNYWNWPSIGEFDIMENVNNLNRGWGTLHCGTNPGGVCNEPSGLGNNMVCPNSPCEGNFHTYSIEVDRTSSPEFLRWYIDGQQYHQINETQLPSDVWEKTVHRPHFILLNLALGGGFPNALAGGDTPLNTTLSGGQLEVRYVAVYNSRASRDKITFNPHTDLDPTNIDPATSLDVDPSASGSAGLDLSL